MSKKQVWLERESKSYYRPIASDCMYILRSGPSGGTIFEFCPGEFHRRTNLRIKPGKGQYVEINLMPVSDLRVLKEY